MNFRAKYESAAATNNSLLCVGLDPDPDKIPAGVDVVDFLKEIIAATSDLVCCYKPNAAFYEALGLGGFARLKEVVDAVPDGVPVLLDAKRGDIGNTARFYAQAIFEHLSVDAVTLSPYLGEDALTRRGVQPRRHPAAPERHRLMKSTTRRRRQRSVSAIACW